MLPSGKLPKHNTFELDDVSTFAVDNSPANIWAAGKSGWYEIQPSKEYQAIYDHMMVGIDLFFTLEDFHTDEAQKTRRCPLDVDLLAKQWQITRDWHKTPLSGVKAEWLKHAKYLLGQMEKKKEVDWSKTPIYAWLATSAPAIYKLYHKTGYLKTFPSASSKADQLLTSMHEVMESNPSRYWTIDVVCKAIDHEQVGLKSWEQVKEHIEVNAATILPQLDAKYLGGSVSTWLLEKAFEKELELGNQADSKDDIGPKVYQRAYEENKRRNTEFATTVVNGVMAHCIKQKVYNHQELTIESVAHEMWRRWDFKSSEDVVDRIQSTATAVLVKIGEWGLQLLNTPIARELAHISDRIRNDEKKNEKAEDCALRYREEYDEQTKQLQRALKDWGTPDCSEEEIKAKTISLLATDLLDDDEMTFTNMTIEDLAIHMVKHFDLSDTDFATRVIKTNAWYLYSIMDLKYANTPLRKHLLDATVKETMIMDKSYGEVELIPRSAIHKDSKPLVPEHVTRATSRNMSNASASASAQPTPRKKSIMDTEMTDVHTPITRHPAGKRAGKASTRRPVGTPLIPLCDFSNDEDDGSPKRRKLNGDGRPSVSFAKNSPTPEPEILYESEESDEEGAQYSYVLEEIDLGQTEEPNGPDGLWSCEREGCTTVIRRADEEEGRNQVRRHFLWHADEIEKRYNLVKSAERPYLPVGNLLKHFEKVGGTVLAKQERGAEKDGHGITIPKPIKRAL